MVIMANKNLKNKIWKKEMNWEKWWNRICKLEKFLIIGNVQPLRNTLKELILLWTVKWMEGRGYKLYCYVTVIKKLLTSLNNVDWKIRMFLFTNFSNNVLQEHFRVAAAKPLKQL